MQLQETLAALDSLLQESQLQQAETLLLETIRQASEEGDLRTALVLRNELIGFYRDCGRFPEALETVSRTKEILHQLEDVDAISYATTLLNCANAYRAAGAYDQAFADFGTVYQLYETHLPPEDSRFASYWNNLALLYQDTAQWEQACVCLEQALSLVRGTAAEDPDASQTRVAISCTNLAVSLLRLHRTAEAVPLLEEANRILAGRSPSDFHYSAVLAGLGDACYQQGQFLQAASYYEQALAEIALHMGENNFYQTVSENLQAAYDSAGSSRPALSGLELSRRYYKAFGEPVLERQFPDVLPRLAIGLAGEGSACLGYDDAYSWDHDAGPGFCIWIPDDLPAETADALQKAYHALPRQYYGYSQQITQEGACRVGVCRKSAFFQRLLGLDDIPGTEQAWLSVGDGMLAAACSGEIFRDDSHWMTDRRRILAMGYPEEVENRLLAQALGRMAQCGQYNYERMRNRSDFLSAQMYLTEFCRNTLLAMHLLAGKYPPYEKWLARSARELDGGASLVAQLEQLLRLPPEQGEQAVEQIHQICGQVWNLLRNSRKISDTGTEDGYMEQAASQLAKQAEQLEQHKRTVEQLVRLEFETFDSVQNMGGRAACQDDWETFSIMRRSQYLPWPEELLTQWLEAFRQAAAEGRNLITEKYARMMETTDPAEYQTFAAQLPPLSDEFLQIRETILAIQVGWMEEFAQDYPGLASRSRVIHTAADSPAETSYETYLRGELSAYPMEVLYGYGRWIVSLHQAGENLTKLILTETVHAYGYQTLEQAEARVLQQESED